MGALNKLISGLDGTSAFDSPSVEFKKKTKAKLDSTQFLKLIDILCEGEIEGFPTPINAGIERGTLNYKIAALADIFLGKTPIMKASTDLKKSEFIEQIIADYNELVKAEEKGEDKTELNNIVPEI